MKFSNQPNKLGKRALIWLATIALSSPTWAAGYTIIDLGVAFKAADINNSGQISGTITSPGYENHATLYSNGIYTDLSPLLGTSSSGRAINNSGTMTGSSGSVAVTRAYTYNNGTVTDLGTLGSSYVQYNATAINDNGDVVGSVYTNNERHSFLYSNGVMTDLGKISEYGSTVNGINNIGHIVGSMEITQDPRNAQSRAFLYENGIAMNLGTLGGKSSAAYAINQNGQVVGAAQTANGDSHAFFYSNGAMIDLGTLAGTAYSSARDINNKGQVVGSSGSKGVLYSNGQLMDLNALLDPGTGWNLASGLGINDRGQIIGRGLINGEWHSYLLSPSSVPVPASAWLFGSGLLGLAGVVRKRRIAR